MTEGREHQKASVRVCWTISFPSCPLDDPRLGCRVPSQDSRSADPWMMLPWLLSWVFGDPVSKQAQRHLWQSKASGPRYNHRTKLVDGGPKLWQHAPWCVREGLACEHGWGSLWWFCIWRHWSRLPSQIFKVQWPYYVVIRSVTNLAYSDNSINNCCGWYTDIGII